MVLNKKIKSRVEASSSPDGAQELIASIIKHYGGPKALHKVVKVHIPLHYQSFVNWRTRGHVPLKYVVHIAELLKVSPYSLNYLGYSKMLNDKPTWSSVVRSNSPLLGAKTVKRILTLKAPSDGPE